MQAQKLDNNSSKNHSARSFSEAVNINVAPSKSLINPISIGNG
jgi:hypothetical protein